MSNSLLTIDMITRQAVELFKNSNAFLMNVDRQYDDQFANTGAKIGSTLRIRLPNDYTVTDGPALSTQDTAEVYTSLTVSSQKHVDVAFTTAERALSLQDYSTRILAPAINNLCGAIAADLMSVAELFSNASAKFSSGTTVTTPDASTFLNAGALLDINSAPLGRRQLIDSPQTDARVVNALSGLFNPSSRISQQYESGAVKNALGFDWMRDQTVLVHTAGTCTDGKISGANQTGSSVTISSSLGGTYKKGDIITLPGCNAVNRVTKQDTGELRQFVVTADTTIGSSSSAAVPIYPAITPAGSGGVAVQYQTVTASPTNAGSVVNFLASGEQVRNNFAFCPEALTIAFADLELPRGVHEVSRVSDDDVSMRVLTDYIPTSDQMVTRIDVLYGYQMIRGEWGCKVYDAL